MAVLNIESMVSFPQTFQTWEGVIGAVMVTASWIHCPHTPNNLLPSYFQAENVPKPISTALDPAGGAYDASQPPNPLGGGPSPHSPPLRRFWRLDRGPRQPGGPRAPKGVKTALGSWKGEVEIASPYVVAAIAGDVRNPEGTTLK